MCQIPENIQEMAKKIKRISLFLQPSVLVRTQRGLCYFVLRRTACCTAHVLAEWMSASVSHWCWGRDTARRAYSRPGRCYTSSSRTSWSCWRSALHHMLRYQRSSSCSTSSSSCLNTHSTTHASQSAPREAASVARDAGLTHAVVSSVDLHVLRRTDAGVVPNGVITLTRTTDAGTLTLVHICTHTHTHTHTHAHTHRHRHTHAHTHTHTHN